MTFQPFHTSRLALQEQSTPIDFVVLLDAEQTFIRVIARLNDNEIHGGNAPTFLIQAGVGEPATVDVDTEPADIKGSATTIVATATCRRPHPNQDPDIFLITIDHHAASGPWQLKVQNNEPQPLNFNGFISHQEDETLKPWADIQGTPTLGGTGPTTADLVVRNLGTDTLNISTKPADPIGNTDFPATFKTVPRSVSPHHATTVTVQCPALAEVATARSETFTTILETDDPDPSHETFSVRVQQPELPATFCRESDGCRMFIPRAAPDDDQCETCFHSQGFHGMKDKPGPHF